MMRILFILCLAVALSPSVRAQNPKDQAAAEQFRQDMAQRQRAMLMQTMDSAIALLNDGAYEAADVKFLYVLNNIKSVPSDLTFYFGKNSFYLNKHKQGADWLNKYVQLKGTQGQYYEEAVDLIKKAEAEIVKERLQETANVKQVLSKQYDIDCGPAGKVVCPVCKGTTVLIRKGPFGDQYRTCQYCDKHGNLTCDEYNLLLRGELEPKNQ